MEMKRRGKRKLYRLAYNPFPCQKSNFTPNLRCLPTRLEAMALGYALTELRIFPMGKTLGEKKKY
jgi:hypothetical protein